MHDICQDFWRLVGFKFSDFSGIWLESLARNLGGVEYSKLLILKICYWCAIYFENVAWSFLLKSFHENLGIVSFKKQIFDVWMSTFQTAIISPSLC